MVNVIAFLAAQLKHIITIDIYAFYLCGAERVTIRYMRLCAKALFPAQKTAVQDLERHFHGYSHGAELLVSTTPLFYFE